MENQSGFPKRRTDFSDLSARLKVISELPESSRQTRWWQKRDDVRYNQPYNCGLRTIQRNPRDKRKYSNI